MVKAGNADGVARVLGARARYLAGEQQPEPALADALRSVVLMDVSPETPDARQAFALAARTVAAPFAQLEALGWRGPGLGLAHEYTALARYWEPRAKFAAIDAGGLRVLARTMGDRNRARPPSWRPQVYDPRDVEDARMCARNPDPTAQVVVGLGCGRCGTSSLAALLKRYGAVTHESTLPDCRVVLWSDAEDAAARRVDWWRKRGSALVGDVNYAHLPNARVYLELGAKIVGLRRDKHETVRSFAAWTEPGGAPGSLAPRDHWRDHDASEFQYDDWDLTFPKFNDAPTKLDAIEAYYDDYYTRLAHLEERSVFFRLVSLSILWCLTLVAATARHEFASFRRPSSSRTATCSSSALFLLLPCHLRTGSSRSLASTGRRSSTSTRTPTLPRRLLKEAH